MLRDKRLTLNIALKNTEISDQNEKFSEVLPFQAYAFPCHKNACTQSLAAWQKVAEDTFEFFHVM